MSGAGIVEHLMEWLLAGPLPTGPEHDTEEPPDHVPPGPSPAVERD